jgi:NAD(P)-dependent dehydrogenase (short-subunit alcohol dehydrogenase family)
MGKIICVIGNKGGTGKTTLSHMLAHGLGLFGMRAVAVLTDELRDKLSKVNRTYLPFDARSADQLATAAARLRATEGWIGVIDGGGNRPDIDRKLAAMADLVLLPFRDSHEDMRTVSRDLERFPQAWALPSQWPTNLWAAACATRSIDSQLAIHKDRILAPVFALSASKQLLMAEAPANLPRNLNNASREIALQALELLGIPAPEAAWLGPQSGLTGNGRGAFGALPGRMPSPSILHA